MNNKIIEILKDVSVNNISLDEAKEMLLEFDEDGYWTNEVEYLEEHYLIDIGIKSLIEDIEGQGIATRKPSLDDLERVINSMDSNKLLLSNMVMITVN